MVSLTCAELLQKQEAIRVGFGSGHLNVLFATTVGSEGLDFRQCQLVLAFDMPPNVVQLVQSGGRARAHQSRYIILQDPSQRKAVTKLLRWVGVVLRGSKAAGEGGKWAWSMLCATHRAKKVDPKTGRT